MFGYAGDMGRAMSASDVQAGREIDAGSLTFREQYSAASTSDVLSRCWMTAFEDTQPIRRVAAYKGQRNFAGLWWCTTNQRHVEFESWLEREHLIRLDFDTSVTGISSQPFKIALSGLLPRASHVPDYFVRRVGGTGVVIDVRPDARVKPEDKAVFEATAELCASVGWEYQRFGDLPVLGRANRYWISRYRNPRCRREETANDALVYLRVHDTATLRETARALGDPVLVLPTIYHLLWTQEIRADFDGQRLHLDSRVWKAETT